MKKPANKSVKPTDFSPHIPKLEEWQGVSFFSQSLMFVKTEPSTNQPSQLSQATSEKTKAYCLPRQHLYLHPLRDSVTTTRQHREPLYTNQQPSNTKGSSQPLNKINPTPRLRGEEPTDPPKVHISPITFEQGMEALIQDLIRLKYTAISLKSYRVHLNVFGRWLGTQKPKSLLTDLTQLQTHHIKAYQQHIKHSGRTRPGKYKCLMTLRRMLQLLNQQNRLNHNPAANVLNRASQPLPSNNPIQQAIDGVLLEMTLQQLRPQTVNNARKQLRYFHSWLQQQAISNLRDIQQQDMNHYWHELMQSDLAHQYKQAQMSVVKRLLQAQKITGQLLLDPSEHIHIASQAKGLPRMPLTQAQVQHLLSMPNLKTVDGLRDKAAMELLYSTAMRVGEIAKIQLQHIDFELGTVLIPEGKGGTARVVPLGVQAKYWVQRYLTEARSVWLSTETQRYVFISQQRTPMHTHVCQRFVAKYGKQAGIKQHVRPHLIRHSCATHLLQQGANLRIIQVLLGHVQIDTTHTYTRLVPVEVKAMHDEFHPIHKIMKPLKSTKTTKIEALQ
jgi:integrase/recombinase XerD